MRTYLDIFNATAVEAGCRVGVHQYWTAPHLTPEAVIQGGQAFARAVDASTDVRYADRLKIAMMSVYYVAIYRWDELLTYAKAHSMKWPFGDSWQSAWAEFSSSWTRVGATMSMEGGFDLPDIYRRAKDPTLWPANIEWQPISCPPTCPCGD